ncbi:MAG: putative peptidoglycan hydrolase [Prokaryotic dsDNA virus sp.]|nr:MAG: putative peptidoglycan hydrolase [Prokaryotic dsDNA virus sp.]
MQINFPDARNLMQGQIDRRQVEENALNRQARNQQMELQNIQMERQKIGLERERQIANTQLGMQLVQDTISHPGNAMSNMQKGIEAGIFPPTIIDMYNNASPQQRNSALTQLGGEFQSRMDMFNPQQPPDKVEMYEYARGQGYAGSFQDWLTENRQPLNQINMPAPAPPSGYQNIYNDEGQLVRQAVIPGGPAALEIENKREQTRQRLEASKRGGRLVKDEIDRAFSLIDPRKHEEWWQPGPAGTAGRIIRKLTFLPETDATQLANVLDTIKGRIGFNYLQEMRENSPTGGALGQVSNIELQFLMSVFGSIKPDQAAHVLAYNLARLDFEFSRVINGWGQMVTRDANGNALAPEDHYRIPMPQGVRHAPEKAYEYLFNGVPDPKNPGQNLHEAFSPELLQMFEDKYGYMPTPWQSGQQIFGIEQ